MGPLLAAAAACVATVFAIYGFALRNSWCCDDTQILQHALRLSPGQYFFEPSAWRALIPYSLTPWLSLTCDLDHALAGLNPWAYYALHLLMIGLAATLIWRLAALWVGTWFGAAGAGLFLLGAAITQATQLLMVRHYTEGLFFCLLALLLLPLLPLVRFPGLVAGNERCLIGLWAALSLVFAVALGTALRAGQGRPRWPARLLACLLIERDAARQHLSWQFSAAQAGRYSLLAPGQRIDVPAANGALRREQALPPCFRIRFDALDGGIGYSPPLSLPPADAQGRQRLQWQGIGELPLGPAAGAASGAALVTAPATTPPACLPLPSAAASQASCFPALHPPKLVHVPA